MIKKFIYFTFQSNSTKHNKLISWSNFPEGHHILSPEIWGNTFTDWLKKCSDVYIFSISYKLPYLLFFLLKSCDTWHRMDNAPNILCPRCKERVSLPFYILLQVVQNYSELYKTTNHAHFIFYCKLSKNTLDFMRELINLNYSFNIPFKINLIKLTWWELLLNSMMV